MIRVLELLVWWQHYSILPHLPMSSSDTATSECLVLRTANPFELTAETEHRFGCEANKVVNFVVSIRFCLPFFLNYR